MQRFLFLLPVFAVALAASAAPRDAGAIDSLPAIPQPSRPGDIVGVKLQNAAATAEPAGYVTFGEVFKPGTVRPTEALIARVDRRADPVQMDVKATNADGSVRHAVLTFRAPAIPAGASIGVMLAKGSAPPPAKPAPAVSALLASGYNVTTGVTFEALTPQARTASAAAALNAAKTPQLWLSGPLVREYIVGTTVGDGLLKIEFDIAAYADGTTKTDVIYDNSWFFNPGKKDLVYAVTIAQNGRQIYAYSRVTQWLYSLWHHEVDSAGAIHPNIQYDVAYLEATGATWHYDTGLGGVADETIQDFQKCNHAHDSSATAYWGSTKPMGAACVATYFGAVGGRVEGDWGPEPEWVVNWLLSQNATARSDMMEDADASGSIPWHYTDEKTGDPINPEAYPTFITLREAPPFLQPASGWPPVIYGSTPAANGDPWNPDVAHMPDLNYFPYLITGSHYQLMLFNAQGVWSIASVLSRNQLDTSDTVPLGISAAVFNQTRAMAYELRQVAEAAYIDPDTYRLKSMFVHELDKALTGYIRQYVTDDENGKNGQIDGFVAGYAGPNYGSICTFEEDVVVDSFALVAGMQLPRVSAEAVQMMKYMDHYVAGRFLHGADGFSPYYGASYWTRIYDQAEAPFTTWYEFAAGNGAFGFWTPPTGPLPAFTATLQADAAGSLKTATGTFSLGAQTKSGERVIVIRTGHKPPFRFGAAVELAAGADGQVYSRTRAGQWLVFSDTLRPFEAEFYGGPAPTTFRWNSNINGSVNDGYSIIAQSALANLVTYVHSPEDRRAYDWVVTANYGDLGGQTGVRDDFRRDPQWDIVPARP